MLTIMFKTRQPSGCMSMRRFPPKLHPSLHLHLITAPHPPTPHSLFLPCPPPASSLPGEAKLFHVLNTPVAT